MAKSFPLCCSKSRSDDGSSTSIDEGADLCPRCGDPLPRHPSAELRQEIDAYQICVALDAGRCDHAGTSERLFELCARIRLETEQIKEAHRAGWPVQFDVVDFTRRVCRNKILSEIRLVLMQPRRSEVWKYLREMSRLEVLSESEYIISMSISHNCVGAG